MNTTAPSDSPLRIPWGLFLAFLTYFGLMVHPVMAQIGIGVSPPHRAFILPPGGSARAEAVFFTQHNYQGSFVFKTFDWTIDPENGTVIPLNDGSSRYSASGWLRANLPRNPTQFEKGHPEITVRYELRVPQTPTLQGTYWTAIALHTLPVPGRTAKGIKVNLSINVLHIVYVTIAGTERPDAAIQAFDLDPAKNALVLDVVNKGNVYLRLHPSLVFRDARGKAIKSQKLAERVLLRDGLIRYRIPLKDVPKEAVVAAVEVEAKGLVAPLYAEVALR